MIVIDNMEDHEIIEWCKESNLPNYVCINNIREIAELELNNADKIWYAPLIEINYNDNIELKCQKYTISDSTGENYNMKFKKYIQDKYISSYKSLAIQNNCVEKHEIVLIIDKINKKKYKAVFEPNNYNVKTYSNIHMFPTTYILYKDTNGKIWKSSIDNYDFIEDDTELPSKYYWKTPDGWLYLYDKDKPEIISLDILDPLPVKNVIRSNISTEPLINSDILLFANTCCKKTDKTNLRFGLKDIFKIYEMWCKINGKKCLKIQKKFKEEFEKINYKEETSKGVDVNNKPGKRGYNIMVSL